METNNSASFFANKDCKFYPCHKCDTDINCLFCYCPLYHLDDCPGDYEIIEKEGRSIKNCKNCTYPHIRENYKNVIALLRS